MCSPEVRPVTPPEEREAHRKSQPPERKLTVANTDLLFKLFDVVADDKKASVHKARQQNKCVHQKREKHAASVYLSLTLSLSLSLLILSLYLS